MKILAGMIHHAICVLVNKETTQSIQLVGNPELLVNHVRIAQGNANLDETLYIIGSNTDDFSQQKVFQNEKRTFLFSEKLNSQQLFELAFEAYALLQTWCNALSELIANDATLDELFIEGRRLIKRPVMLLSREMLVIASNNDNRGNRKWVKVDGEYQLSPKEISYLFQDAQYDAIIKNRQPYYITLGERSDTQSYAYNIFQNNLYLGCIVYDLNKGESYLTEGEKQVLEVFSFFLSNAYQHFSGNVAASKSQGDPVHVLGRRLLGKTKIGRPETLSNALSQYGWSVGDVYSLMKLDFLVHTKWREASLYISHLLEKHWDNTCAIIWENSVVLVVNESCYLSKANPTDIQHRCRIDYEEILGLAKNHACQIGISDTFCGFDLLETSYRQADLALRIGTINNPEQSVYYFSDFVLDYMLGQITVDFSAKQLCNHGLLLLLNHDRQNGTRYYEALKVYLDTSRNATHAARLLFVHRSTLLRWLEAIEEISGIDLDNEKELLHVMLSYEIMNRAGVSLEEASVF